MIVGVESGCCDLHANCRGETKSVHQVYSPKSESGSKKNLVSAGILSCCVECGIRLEFRPKLPNGVVLEGAVPFNLPPQLCSFPCWKIDSDRGLNVEPAPTFAKRNRWA